MFIGSGTVINMITVLLGTALGVTIGHRITDQIRSVVTDGLGLVTAMVATLTTASITDPVLKAHLAAGYPVLIVLGSIVIGGIVGTALRIEDRLAHLGDALKARLASDGDSPFTEGFVAASLLFCIGALAILGSIQDGLGQGNEMLVMKATLDFFAATAFASTFGWGVGASALSVGVYQGAFTAAGYFLGNVISPAQVAMLSAIGGLLIAGIALRLLGVRQVPVGNMLPALLFGPLLVGLLAH
jgi:uncharacterized membrane protein YqgA involved in biofilm formation